MTTLSHAPSPQRLLPTFAALVVFAIFAGAPPVGAAQADLPTPSKVMGLELGADYTLADYDQIQRYFAALDAASDRIVVEEIGRSTLDRPMLLALISSEANLADLDRLRGISERLAHARDLTQDEARSLANQGRAIVWIDGGLHATEVAHGQFMPELAYHMVSAEDPETRRIRDEVVLLLMVNMNPDGLDMVVEWYERNLGTEYETAPMVELYQHYIGHDNNRDWYMFTQVESQAVARQLYHRWFPQIVYNHHQSGPFPGRIWTPPFENPVNPNLDPFVVSSINHLGEAMKRRFAREGKPGVSSGILYDMWWNGSMRGAPDFHNMLGFLTETALYRYATPYCYSDDEIPEYFSARAGGIPARRPTTQYPDPWLGGCWHLRDPMNYMMTASLAVLDQAARFREDYLLGIYQAGRRQIERGERAEGGPFAYVINVEAQHDASAAVELLQTFRKGGVEIRQADRPFVAGEATYPTGTYVIPPQAFRPYVVDLMDPKVYPDRRQYPGGPPEPPYDMTGYELGLQSGVSFDRVFEPFEVPTRTADEIAGVPGGVDGTGRVGYILSPASNRASTAVLELLDAGARVGRVVAADGARRQGSFVVRDVGRADVERIAVRHGVRFEALERLVEEIAPLRKPLIGLYQSYRANMPEGWTRWMFERYGFEYETLKNHDVRTGDLSRFDAIVLPDEEASAILDGWSPGTVPEEFVGGLGTEGAHQLSDYVEAGGWLIAMDHAVDFAIEQFDLPVTNPVAGLPSQEFFIPGSLLHVEIDTTDPLAAGMRPEAIAFFVRSQVLEVDESAPGAGDVDVYARYSDSPLASGWAHGAAEHLAGKPAALSVPFGQGTVVLLAFEPHFRGQPLGTFKLLFAPLFEAATQRN